MNVPDFDLFLGGDDIWGDITDEDVFRTIAIVEEENKKKNETKREDSPATDPRPSGVEHQATKRRFAEVSEEELDKIESGRHEKKTLDSTAWSVKLIKSE